MARQLYLIRRNGTYYVRIPVPVDLVAATGGKKQIWRSLHTKERSEATRLAIPVLDQLAAAFDDLRRRRDLSTNDLANAVWDHYSAGLEADDAERQAQPTPEEIDRALTKAIAEGQASGAFDAGPAATVTAMADVEILAHKYEWSARRRAARLARLRSDLGSGDTRLIERDADAFLAKHRFNVPKGSDKYRQLCDRLTRAEIERLERAAERDKGNFAGKPADPIVTPPCEPLDLDPVGDTIMSVFAQFEKKNPKNVRPETMTQIRRDVQHFADFVGSRVTPGKITKSHISAWENLLIDWPVKAAEVTAWKGLSLHEIVAANKTLPKPKPSITVPTRRRYMNNLKGFCQWLVKNDYLTFNPVVGMLPKKLKGPVNRRSSLTDEQHQKLFSSPLFTTCRGDGWRDLDFPGNVAVRDHRYWIPLIMAYSGARPAEVAQLDLANVRRQQGMWVMHVTEMGSEGKRTKTESSKRVVPIHSELIKLGLIEYHNKLEAAGETRLFPEVEIPKKGQIAAQFSREFNRYMQRLGIKTGKDIVVYSLRHGFMDRARLVGFLNNEIAMIVGHDIGDEKATMTSGYGIVPEGTMKRRAEIVEAVRY